MTDDFPFMLSLSKHGTDFFNPPGNQSHVNQLERWKQQAARLKQEVHALALACKDPRVPWHAKLLALCIVAYALSPIDLIPDFIPILGYLDDLVVVPLGIYFLLKMIPPDVLAECRVRARLAATTTPAARWLAAGVIIIVWIVLAVWAIRFVLRSLVI